MTPPTSFKEEREVQVSKAWASYYHRCEEQRESDVIDSASLATHGVE